MATTTATPPPAPGHRSALPSSPGLAAAPPLSTSGGGVVTPPSGSSGTAIAAATAVPPSPGPDIAKDGDGGCASTDSGGLEATAARHTSNAAAESQMTGSKVKQPSSRTGETPISTKAYGFPLPSTAGMMFPMGTQASCQQLMVPEVGMKPAMYFNPTAAGYTNDGSNDPRKGYPLVYPYVPVAINNSSSSSSKEPTKKKRGACC